MLLVNAGGFAVYLLLLSDMDLFLLSVVVVTAAAGFWVSNRINGWGYRHREEEGEYQRKMRYIWEKSESAALAKDIRIFGLDYGDPGGMHRALQGKPGAFRYSGVLKSAGALLL